MSEVVSGNDQKIDASDKEMISVNDSKHCNGIAGTLKTDKAQLVAEEFDTLFGVKDRILMDGLAGGGGEAASKGGYDITKADGIESMGIAYVVDSPD
jgi:hypothetical protein